MQFVTLYIKQDDFTAYKNGQKVNAIIHPSVLPSRYAGDPYLTEIMVPFECVKNDVEVRITYREGTLSELSISFKAFQISQPVESNSYNQLIVND
jgi:hypothetical protein